MIKEHLLRRGFVPNYLTWINHGERVLGDHDVFVSDHDKVDDEDVIEQMLHDLGDDIQVNNLDKFQQLFAESEKPLYDGCIKYTKLSAVLKLFNIKSNNSWSDTSFTSLLEILHDMLPEDNELPVNIYQAKKLMCPMGLKVERIPACPNDCMLYRNEFKDLQACNTCGTSRYKRRDTYDDEEEMMNSRVKPLRRLKYCGIFLSYQDLNDYLQTPMMQNCYVGMPKNVSKMVN